MMLKECRIMNPLSSCTPGRQNSDVKDGMNHLWEKFGIRTLTNDYHELCL